jgi:hypothetical protein
MEITKEQWEYLIGIITEAQDTIHSEYCYGSRCGCDKYHKAIEMLQKIQRTTATISEPTDIASNV